MTLHDMLNWTTAGGALVAVALVSVAWAETKRQFRGPVSSSPLGAARAATRLREIRLPARRFAQARQGACSGLAGIGLASPAPAAPDQRTSELGVAGSPEPDSAQPDSAQVAVTVPVQAAPAEAEAVPPPVLIREIRLRDHVKAGSVWAPGDSWLTSTTGIASGVLATVALGVGGGESAWLLGLYALSAALAPVVYGALSPANPDAREVTGTVAGYLLAALATLFGGIGMVATICSLGISTSDALAPGLVLGIVGVLIIVAIGSYGFRTIVAVLMTETATPEGDLLSPPPPPGRAPRTSSLLVGSGRRSATL